MMKFGAMAVLAATTVLAGTAWGQGFERTSGILGDETDYFLTPGSNTPEGPFGLSFLVRVTDAEFFGLRFIEGAYNFRDRFQFFKTVNHISQPLPADAEIEAGPVFDNTSYDGREDLNLIGNPFASGLLQVGDRIAILLTCIGDCNEEDEYYFELVGATFSLGPLPVEELAGLVAGSAGAGRLLVRRAMDGARENSTFSLAARAGGDGQLSAKNGDALVVSSKSAGPGLVGNVYSWIEITGFDAQADNGLASVNGVGFQLGADVAVGSDMVAGLSLGRSEISANDGSFTQDGTLTYLQPYFAYGSGTWHGTASLIFGQGDYEQSSAGGDGTGDTKLFAVTFEGGRDFALGERAMITPTLGLVHGSEKVTGTGGSLAGAGTESYDFTQVSLGARVTMLGRSGQYFFGAFADHLDQDAGTTVLADDFLSENGWSGRVEFGGSADLGRGLGLSTSVEIGGLGGSAQTVSGGLRLALTF